MKVAHSFLLLLLGILLSLGAQAHRFAPSLLKVTEIAEQQYHVVWTTPVEATSNISLLPLLPEACKITQAVSQRDRICQ